MDRSSINTEIDQRDWMRGIEVYLAAAHPGAVLALIAEVEAAYPLAAAAAGSGGIGGGGIFGGDDGGGDGGGGDGSGGRGVSGVGGGPVQAGS